MSTTPTAPSGPADVTWPRAALARLAFCAAAQQLAEAAAGEVPTLYDEHARPHEVIDQAARLVALANEALVRAVIWVRERGGSWAHIGEGLEVSRQSAHERFQAAEERWEDALNRPWEVGGHFRASRLPDGADNPDNWAADLDRWCAQHAAPSTRQHAEQDGLADRMVSARLPRHTLLTEGNSVLRYANYLIKQGGQVSDAEREAFEARKADVFGRTQRDEIERQVLVGSQRMTARATRHTARLVDAEQDRWTLSWLPDQQLTRDQANAGVALAAAVAHMQDAEPHPDHDHPLWPCVDHWAAQLGLTGPDALARASESPED